MKYILLISFRALVVLLFIGILGACGGRTINGATNVREIYVERELPYPVETVWQTIFMDYGGAHKFNPNMVNSGYISENQSVAVGVVRFMENSDGGKMHEKLVELNAEERRMRFQIIEVDGVPIDTDVTFGESSIEALGPDRSKFKMKFQYRTKPKILVVFANGSIKKDFENMTIGMEHYLATKENVTQENFKEIAKLYQ